MGICCSVNRVEKEFKRKKRENVLLVTGLPQSGKSKIIEKYIDLYASCKKKEFIKCQYRLKSWIINEFTDPSMEKYAARSYQHFTLINQYPLKNGYRKNNIDNNFKINIDTSGESKYCDLLFCGYLHTLEMNQILINIPLDIIRCIGLFYAELTINSYKIIQTKFKLDLWNLDIIHFKEFSKLFDHITGLLYICDISSLNMSYDANSNQVHFTDDTFKDSLEIFNSLIKDDKLSKRVLITVLFNNMDLFEKKINEINANYVNQFQVNIEDVKKSIEYLFKRIANESIYTHFVTITNTRFKEVFDDINNKLVSNNLGSTGLL